VRIFREFIEGRGVYFLLDGFAEAGMRTGIRQTLSIVTIVAIALHAALWGVAPARTAAATIDPFSIICHSGQDDVAYQAPGGTSSPSHACDHCNLCAAAASSAIPPAVVLLHVVSTGLLQELLPKPIDADARFEVASKSARAPPAVA